MCFGGGAAKVAKQQAAQQRTDEQARQDRITQGMAKINGVFDDPNSGFNDAFYAKQGQAYTDYATPQLDHQYDQQKKSLVYALSRGGLLDSSAGQDQNAELSRDYDQNRLGIANQAKSIEQQARGNVETARGNLVNQLNATGNDELASTEAMRQAKTLNMPQGFSPLGNLFSDISGAVANIGSNAGNNYGGFTGGTGLFNTNRGSMRVVK